MFRCQGRRGSQSSEIHWDNHSFTRDTFIMKKTTRGRIANPAPKKRRVLKLRQETVRVLSATDLAAAAGGSGCDTTSYGTKQHTDGTGVPAGK